MSFQLTVGKVMAGAAQLPAGEARYRRAFASYSAKDRDEVLGRIQGMQKVMPDLEVFFDVASLQPGADWGKRILEEIQQCDVFYLFWSKNARDSVWVEKEWRYALEIKGLDFIIPVPLEPPDVAPPPPELGSKHFNDRLLAFNRPAAPR